MRQGNGGKDEEPLSLRVELTRKFQLSPQDGGREERGNFKRG